MAEEPLTPEQEEAAMGLFNAFALQRCTMVEG